MDRQHFQDLGQILVFVLRCRSKGDVGGSSATSSDVDDSVLETPEPTNKTSPEEQTSAEEHTPTNTNASAGGEPEPDPDPLPGFMNDGAAGYHQFGLDGNGPGPTEQKAWSWNAPYPPMPAGLPPPAGYVPVQQPSAPPIPYGGNGLPAGFSQAWQPGAPFSHGQQTADRPQRHVHFNDQTPSQPLGHGASDQQHSGQNFNANNRQQYSGQNQAPSGAQPVSEQNQGVSAGQHGQQFGSHNPGTSAGQPQEQAYSYLAGNIGQTPQNSFAYQPAAYGPASYAYVNHSFLHGAVPNAQEHGKDFPGANVGYPPPISSYQPVGYSFPGYASWPSVPSYPAHAQPFWPGPSMQGPSYFTPPHLAAPFPPNPYTHTQPTYPGLSLQPIPPPASIHPGGGVWGPPLQPQDLKSRRKMRTINWMAKATKIKTPPTISAVNRTLMTILNGAVATLVKHKQVPRIGTTIMLAQVRLTTGTIPAQGKRTIGITLVLRQKLQPTTGISLLPILVQ